jgi:short-subunit dehydrogenase
MPRRSLDGSRALITGGSSGIGRALAMELARHGTRSVVIARRPAGLDELAAAIRAKGGECIPVAGDVTDGAVRRQALERVVECWGGLDLLVNNAGIGAFGSFESASPERLRRIMEVNFFAPAELIREALPVLKAGTAPLVVNVGSVLGHRAIPGSSEYCASKFALRGLGESLRAEWAAAGIDLLHVSPSTTQSEFFDRLVDSPESRERPTRRATPAATVARLTIRAIQQGRHEIIISPGGKLLVWLNRMAPAVSDRIMARYADRLRKQANQ